jgi:hypothetical protein
VETCVCLSRSNVCSCNYQSKAGSLSTAMEICVGGTCPALPAHTSSEEAAFFVIQRQTLTYVRHVEDGGYNVFEVGYSYVPTLVLYTEQLWGSNSR